ncbi:hypothetical protein GGTG_01134 [Gaeumannomyces tritici R3-111a-1]|uniref:Uncharacterized protein n=1 Tax=Gaeumannomyces tritici (strain R3-111a-1) TaxID=644352 RepID=J3NIQ1_GAET3|nr:hypothetical protein GGTG_01134 [Gaeumannomyces tritici R3-111a-1]EJT81150.1 hypothetical protein GGTG_01134 [Gaeumannomyces tritici R3-111a-1]
MHLITILIILTIVTVNNRYLAVLFKYLDLTGNCKCYFLYLITLLKFNFAPVKPFKKLNFSILYRPNNLRAINVKPLFKNAFSAKLLALRY